MAATSTEVGGLFAEGQGHEIAQGYGLFLWAGVVLYIMVAWRVWSRRNEIPAGEPPAGLGMSHPRSHLKQPAAIPAADHFVNSENLMVF